MRYTLSDKINNNYRISKYLHSVFFEYFGHVIYDGIWVGKESNIPNIDGIRLDVIEGCRELKVGAMRWPGGCCADHYHWKDGIGRERWDRIHPIPDKANPVWRNDFGTDEFLKLCSLTGSEPIITVNTATGTPEEFLDWFEYVNGPETTKYGHLRAENGHPEPYNVRFWGIGNTDENVWHIDFDNPVAYGQTYLKYQTVLREPRKDLYFIGLGLSFRHGLSGWAEKALDHITGNGTRRPPDALSVHHYVGGKKQGGEGCGDAVDYDDDGYYALLKLIKRYEDDIALHRGIIAEHTGKNSNTKICFDEWGVWHPEATVENNQNQRQTVRDGIFAAMTLHLFYRNSDIVELAMETQISNLLQSLFETDGEKFYKTPTFYVMKMLREHANQYLVDLKSDSDDEYLDTVATVSESGDEITVSIVNKHLYEVKKLAFELPVGEWSVAKADIVTAGDVHDYNSFDVPERIKDSSFEVADLESVEIPPHSVVRICLSRR